MPRQPAGGWKFEPARTDIAALKNRRHNPSVTWIGHATVLVQMGGLNVLTDPLFSEYASPVSFAGPKRVVPATPSLAELPHIDVVVISHDHYDHLDAASVETLAALAPQLYQGKSIRPLPHCAARFAHSPAPQLCGDSAQ